VTLRTRRRHPGRRVPHRTRGRDRAFGYACLVLSIFLFLSSSLCGVARAALGNITLTVTQTYNRDGSPGGGTIDFGTLYPGNPVVVSPAVVFEISSDLEWRLSGWTRALPSGAILEEAPQETGLYTTLSSIPAVIRDSQSPCAAGSSTAETLTPIPLR